MRDRDNESIEAAVCFVFALILEPVFLLLWGWAYQCHWNWFVVPAFDARPMGLALSTGVMLCVSLLKTNLPEVEVERTPVEMLSRLIRRNVAFPLLSVAFAGLVRLFL